jgi:hypothetical protein
MGRRNLSVVCGCLAFLAGFGQQCVAGTNDFLQKSYYSAHIHDAAVANGKIFYVFAAAAANRLLGSKPQTGDGELRKIFNVTSASAKSIQSFVDNFDGNSDKSLAQLQPLPASLRAEVRDSLLDYVQFRNGHPGKQSSYKEFVKLYASDVMVKAVRNSQNSGFKAALDASFSPFAGIKIDSSIESILAANRSLPVHNLTDAIQSTAFHDAVSMLQTASSLDPRAAVNHVLDHSDVVLSHVIDVTNTALQALNPASGPAVIQQLRSQFQEGLNNLTVATNLVSTFTSLLDDQGGTLFRVSTQGQLDVTQTIANFAFGEITGALLTGGTLEAGSAMLNLFQGGSLGCSDSAMMEQQLKTMSKQLDALSTALQQGFAKIEQDFISLNQNMAAGFDTINARLTQQNLLINDVIESCQTSLEMSPSLPH